METSKYDPEMEEGKKTSEGIKKNAENSGGEGRRRPGWFRTLFKVISLSPAVEPLQLIPEKERAGLGRTGKRHSVSREKSNKKKKLKKHNAGGKNPTARGSIHILVGEEGKPEKKT